MCKLIILRVGNDLCAVSRSPCHSERSEESQICTNSIPPPLTRGLAFPQEMSGGETVGTALRLLPAAKSTSLPMAEKTFLIL